MVRRNCSLVSRKDTSVPSRSFNLLEHFKTFGMQRGTSPRSDSTNKGQVTRYCETFLYVVLSELFAVLEASVCQITNPFGGSKRLVHSINVVTWQHIFKYIYSRTTWINTRRESQVKSVHTTKEMSKVLTGSVNPQYLLQCSCMDRVVTLRPHGSEEAFECLTISSQTDSFFKMLHQDTLTSYMSWDQDEYLLAVLNSNDYAQLLPLKVSLNINSLK